MSSSSGVPFYFYGVSIHTWRAWHAFLRGVGDFNLPEPPSFAYNRATREALNHLLALREQHKDLWDAFMAAERILDKPNTPKEN